VSIFEIVEDGFNGLLMGEGVTENLVIDPLVECRKDFG
jgi:hypothetical protein